MEQDSIEEGVLADLAQRMSQDRGACEASGDLEAGLVSDDVAEGEVYSKRESRLSVGDEPPAGRHVFIGEVSAHRCRRIFISRSFGGQA